MPIPTDRPSLDVGLLKRYNEQHAGGAFDAKSVNTWGAHAPLDNGLQSRRWTPAGFKVAMSSTEFNKMGGSEYLKGHSTRQYINPYDRR